MLVVLGTDPRSERYSEGTGGGVALVLGIDLENASETDFEFNCTILVEEVIPDVL